MQHCPPAQSNSSKVSTSEAVSDDPLTLSWQRVLREWDDPKAHEALLSIALDFDALPRLAQLYRDELTSDTRGELAKEKLTSIAVLAIETMHTTATPKRRAVPRWMVVVAACLCVSAVLWALSILAGC